MPRDFLAEIEAEWFVKNPEFPALVQEAEKRRAAGQRITVPIGYAERNPTLIQKLADEYGEVDIYDQYRVVATIGGKEAGPQNELRIGKIQVLLGDTGPDTIYLTPEVDTAYPTLKYPVSLKMDAEAGYGVEWVRSIFDREPDEVIDLRKKKVR